MPDARSSDAPPPAVSQWLQTGFHAFIHPYLRRHFHCIGVCREGFDLRRVEPGPPVIIFGNHPSWWDPLLAHYLNRRLLGGRQFHAPIDAAALRQYRVFEKLGFYGIELGTTSGAAAFLRTSMAILASGTTALWITPEGRFCDPRDHAAELMPGLAHLCTKLDRGLVIPMALEYPFWEERLPMCLANFGEPIDATTTRGWDKATWNAKLHQRLRSAQRDLSGVVIARESAAIDPLMLGRVGAGIFYDTMRRFKSWLTRSTFRPGHGEHFR
jgi:1-acyl-sn-glycerol-3-phosphate acyltransferase